MTDIPIFVSSIDGVRGSKPHDFTISFASPIVLDNNSDYYIALDSLNMSYSWHNISAKAYNNNTIRYSPDNGANWHTITFLDGNYRYEDIGSVIQVILESDGNSKSGVKIMFDNTILKVYIQLEPNYQFDLRQGNFNDLIGFDKKVVVQSGYSSNTPNITNSVDNINVHCNLVFDSVVSSNHTDTLYRFSTDNLVLSYPFKVEPRRLLLNRIGANVIKELRIHLSDNLNRPVELNGTPVNLTLLLRSIRVR